MKLSDIIKGRKTAEKFVMRFANGRSITGYTYMTKSRYGNLPNAPLERRTVASCVIDGREHALQTMGFSEASRRNVFLDLFGSLCFTLKTEPANKKMRDGYRRVKLLRVITELGIRNESKRLARERCYAKKIVKEAAKLATKR